MEKVINKYLFSAVVAMFFALPLTASCGDGEGKADDDPVRIDNKQEAIDYALSMGIGWNLGNNLDAHIDGVAVEDGWGNGKATQKTFDAIRAAGFRTVRIPVTWMGHVGGAPNYRIDKEWLDRVVAVAGYAKAAGLKAIINIHHDGYAAETNPAKRAYHWLDVAAASKDDARNEEIQHKLEMMWMQIAERFKDEGDWLMFETLNEIHDGKWGQGENRTDGGLQYRTLNEWNQVCVYAIRATGGCNETRYIGVPGYVCNPDLTVQYLRIPDDVVENRIMVAVHSYDPWDYAGAAKYNEWGHTGKDLAPNGLEQNYNDMLNRLYNKFVRSGIPVYFGEFGSVHRATAKAENFRKYYLRYVCKSLRDHKMPAIYWDNGSTSAGEEGFGIINHSSGRFLNNGEEIARSMIDSWENDDPDFTIQSVYNTAP